MKNKFIVYHNEELQSYLSSDDNEDLLNNLIKNLSSDDYSVGFIEVRIQKIHIDWYKVNLVYDIDETEIKVTVIYEGGLTPTQINSIIKFN